MSAFRFLKKSLEVDLLLCLQEIAFILVPAFKQAIKFLLLRFTSDEPFLPNLPLKNFGCHLKTLNAYL